MIFICFGSPLFVSISSAVSGVYQGGSFSDRSFLDLIALEAFCSCGALAVLSVSGFSLATLVPRASLRGLLIGIGLYLVTTLVVGVLLLSWNDAMHTQPVAQLLKSSSVSLPVVVASALVSGTFEEVFLLGFLLQGLRRFGFAICVGVPLLVRLLYHVYQGPLGALSVTMFGFMVSVYYFRKMSLFPVVVCHIIADIVPFLGK